MYEPQQHDIVVKVGDMYDFWAARSDEQHDHELDMSDKPRGLSQHDKDVARTFINMVEASRRGERLVVRRLHWHRNTCSCAVCTQDRELNNDAAQRQRDK